MNTIKSIRTNDNNSSSSRAKQFINVPVIGADNNLLNGEYKYKFKGEEETVCRFVEGFLDGNIYDDKGNIVERRPALEYGFGGVEYWTKGCPDGFPAIIQNFGYYEEDWKNGQIQEIRNEVELEELS